LWILFLSSKHTIMAPAVPASLKPVQPYITKADEMKTADPVVSYYCMSFLDRINAKANTGLSSMQSRLV